ncbi:MAG: acyltransferase [Aquihabitans sp.]
MGVEPTGMATGTIHAGAAVTGRVERYHSVHLMPTSPGSSPTEARPAEAAAVRIDVPRPSIRLPYAPGLDGLRGAAVAAVLVFHAAPATWAPGGFLGVSLFFTLSGYLIASLILVEVDVNGHVDLLRFWARRARRLLPALVVAVVGVVVMSQTIEVASDVRRGLLGGLTYSANWVQLSSGSTYADLFRTPSPVTHLWSLAIEEQFYVVFPFLVWLVVRSRPAALRRWLMGGSLAVAAIGLATSIRVDDPAFTYYATHTRGAEIAWGVLAACIVRFVRRPAPTALTVAGVLAAMLTLWTWRTTHLSDTWVGHGGLVVFGVASAVLIAAAARPGPVGIGLGWWPLRQVGRISYGLYLYHWPVVVLLAPPRVNWAPVTLFVARVALSLLLAVASFVLVEQPVRKGQLRWTGSNRRTLQVSAVGLCLAVLLVLVVVPGPSQTERVAAPAVVDVADLPVVPADGTTVPDAGDSGDPVGSTVPAAPAGPTLMALFGDSVPNWLVRDGGDVLDPDEVALIDGSSEGCDGAEGAPVGRTGTGAVVTVPESCTGWRTQYPAALAGVDQVKVAVLFLGSGAILDRELDGSFHGPCGPVAHAWYANDVAQRLAYLSAQAQRTVVVLPAWSDEQSRWVNPADHLDRTDCVRVTLREAAENAGAEVIDLAELICPDGREQCRPLRRDGVHVSPEHAGEVLGWLMDQVLG